MSLSHYTHCTHGALFGVETAPQQLLSLLHRLYALLKAGSMNEWEEFGLESRCKLLLITICHSDQCYVRCTWWMLDITCFCSSVHFTCKTDTRSKPNIVKLNQQFVVLSLWSCYLYPLIDCPDKKLCAQVLLSPGRKLHTYYLQFRIIENRLLFQANVKCEDPHYFG